jgi:DNA-binding response OmpR family regulator
MRIALLEDDLDQAKLMQVWLFDSGYHPYIYLSGTEMLARIQAVHRRNKPPREDSWRVMLSKEERPSIRF